MVSLTDLRLRAVRARIAEVVCVPPGPASLGGVRLRPHQRRAVARVLRLMAHHGGCLLADDVGRGKTYVALAVSRQWTQPLIVVPASLRTTWRRAMAEARLSCAMLTHEALSRGSLPSFAPDGVIVDESHRFRSPEAKRHATLAAITAHAPVLLLSATPLQNGTRDLAAQLALFLGGRAFRSSASELARFIVRGAPVDGADELPEVAPPAWLHPGHDDGAVLRAILALPAPARALDAGDAGALRTIGLVRAWASSRAALLGALRRRLRAVTALEQCAANGRVPSRRDLRIWHGADGDVQLALTPLLVARSDDRRSSVLLDAAIAERAGLDRVRAAIRDSPDPDLARVAELRRLRVQHPAARILAFSESATTVRALFALMRADAGVGMLTATEARIASGRLPREAMLDRFAPVSQGARDPLPRERVTLLLSTDLLSEGVNLQDASVLVHLDLPWNPARLAQRLGRVRRPGGAPVVHSYLMSPPATTELLLRVDARLRAKLAQAERAIGRALDVLPTLSDTVAVLGGGRTATGGARDLTEPNAEALGVVVERVARWRRAAGRVRVRRSADPMIAAATCADDGWLAALDDGRLIARVATSRAGGGAAVTRAVELACGPARTCGSAERARALAEAAALLEREAVMLDCGIRDEASLVDAAVERRISRLLARAARHERAGLVGLATQLRGRLGRPRPLGAERELERLATAHADGDLGDAEWLARSLRVTDDAAPHRAQAMRPHIVALIVLGPGPD
jgi:superfamily II DNA or RNA helicase